MAMKSFAPACVIDRYIALGEEKQMKDASRNVHDDQYYH